MTTFGPGAWSADPGTAPGILGDPADGTVEPPAPAAGVDAGPAPDRDAGGAPEPQEPADTTSGTGRAQPAAAATAAVPSPLLLWTFAVQAACLVAVVVTGRPERVVLLAAAALPAVLAFSAFTVHSRSLAAWAGIWVRWRQRRRRVAEFRSRPGSHNPLWLLQRRLHLGAVQGFRHTELGVLHAGDAWVSSLWVTERERFPADAPDALTSLLSLPASAVKGTSLHAVLQQSSALLDDAASPQLTGWLTIRVDPLAAMAPAAAVSAVPAMIRSEVRRLQREAVGTRIELVPLDRGDLLSALATSAEVGFTPDDDGPVGESWREWSANGRTHHGFEVRPRSGDPLPVLVSLAMDHAAQYPDAVLTVQVPFRSGSGRSRGRLPVFRVSHPDRATTAQLADEVMSVLDAAGAATRSLSGRHGPAVLDTSVLAGAPRT